MIVFPIDHWKMIVLPIDHWTMIVLPIWLNHKKMIVLPIFLGTNDSTSNRSWNNDSTSKLISPWKYDNNYATSLKKYSTYDKKDRDKIDILLAICRDIHEKLGTGSINQKEKRKYATNIELLVNLKYFKEEIYDILVCQDWC